MAITVSRSDIRTDKIVDYSSETRFLKLPVEPYLDLLGIEALPSQKALINAINNPKYRQVVAALSRRQGKTYIANIIGQLVSLVPNSKVLIMSPNYSLSQISFDLQRQLIRHFDLEVKRDNAKDKIIVMSNDSEIRMGSVTQVDSCVGRSYDLIIFDEAALSADGMDAFNVALRPTLDKPNSKAIFISTPRGRLNWFAELYERGFDEGMFEDWCSIKATWKDNPRANIRDIEQAKAAMSEAEFRQEYEADFNTYEGRIWNFDSEKCTGSFKEMDTSDFEIFAGMDIGFRDPTAFCVVGYEWSTGDYYILDEFHDAELTTEQQAAKINYLVDKWDIGQIFIDAAAQQTRFDLAQNYGISTNNAKKSLPDGIGAVGNICDNNKLHVDQNCRHVLYCLDQYRWDPNPNLLKEKPVHDKASHMADAVRYALYSFEISSGIF